MPISRLDLARTAADLPLCSDHVVLPIVIAIAEELKLPVRFLGVGEKMEDLVSFDAESFAAALFSKN
jgi:hypothetical protein